MQQPLSSPIKKAAAFSAPEVLGVTAIVAVLAAVLFPVFGQSLKSSPGSCLANRQQSTRAILLYSQDYDDFMAPNSSLRLHLPYLSAGRTVCPTFGPVGMPKYLHIRGHANLGFDAACSNLIWHNGSIMPFSHTESIFWGQSWPRYTGDKISGMDSWYTGYGGTGYANTNTEYTGTNGQVGTQSNFLGHIIDGSRAPKHGPSVQTVLNEVCSRVGNNVQMDGMGYYAVYSDQGRGNAGYCAWHSYGTCNGVPVQIAFFFNLDGDPGCDPQSSVSGESQGLKAIANVSGHELSEAVTDPRNGGWWDSSGAENGDKCAWTFGATSVTFSNNSKWKIQGNWSNAACNSGTGYGPIGCIQTK